MKSVNLSMSPSLCLYICLIVCQFVTQSGSICICASVFFSTSLFLCLSVCLSVCDCEGPFISMSTCFRNWHYVHISDRWFPYLIISCIRRSLQFYIAMYHFTCCHSLTYAHITRTLTPPPHTHTSQTRTLAPHIYMHLTHALTLTLNLPPLHAHTHITLTAWVQQVVSEHQT